VSFFFFFFELENQKLFKFFWKKKDYNPAMAIEKSDEVDEDDEDDENDVDVDVEKVIISIFFP